RSVFSMRHIIAVFETRHSYRYRKGVMLALHETHATHRTLFPGRRTVAGPGAGRYSTVGAPIKHRKTDGLDARPPHAVVEASQVRHVHPLGTLQRPRTPRMGHGE